MKRSLITGFIFGKYNKYLINAWYESRKQEITDKYFEDGGK